MADEDLYKHCDAHVLTDAQRILFRAEVKRLAKEMAGLRNIQVSSGFLTDVASVCWYS